VDEVGHRVFDLPEAGQTPTAALDVVIEDLITEAMPAQPRGHALRLGESTVPEAVLEEPVETPPVQVSPERRSMGMLIAFALFAVLLVAAAWFLARQISGANDTPVASAPKV